jgi:hypothetical protein
VPIGNAHPNPNRYSHRRTYSEPNSNANRDSSSYPYTNADRHTYGYSNSDASTDGDPYSYSYQYPDAGPDHTQCAWLQGAGSTNGRPLMDRGGFKHHRRLP